MTHVIYGQAESCNLIDGGHLVLFIGINYCIVKTQRKHGEFLSKCSPVLNIYATALMLEAIDLQRLKDLFHKDEDLRWFSSWNMMAFKAHMLVDQLLAASWSTEIDGGHADAILFWKNAFIWARHAAITVSERLPARCCGGPEITIVRIPQPSADRMQLQIAHGNEGEER